jgi:CO/xanthine dehydrogenase Mo-binding subunit
MGGAFGAKAFVRLEAIVAALARKAGAPVRAVLPRSEEWLTLNRHPSVIRIAVGARADGELVAKRVEAWVDTGAYADCGPGVAQKIGYTVVGPYRIPNVRVDSRCVYTNLPPNGAFRGYGATQAVWASERLMDMLAQKLDVDPVELRLRNVLRDGDRFCTGEVVHDVRFAECLEAAADAIGWHGSRRGKGLCVLLKGMQTPSRAEIGIEAEDDGYVLRCATAEMGQGARAAIGTMAAELLGVDPERVRFPDPDTDLVPYDTRTTSSRSTYMMGRALEEAVRDLRSSGGSRGFGRVVNEGGLEPETGQGVASTHWHQGAAAAEVAVDEETGKVDVLRLHAAVYAGRVVNRAGAELQNEGSMIMGLGTALFESVEFADGQVTNANLGDYMVPSAADVPTLTHELIEREGAEVHGLGETALPPVPAAIGNALASLGLHVRELPITAEAALAALDARGHPEPPPGPSITGTSARVGDETVTKA